MINQPQLQCIKNLQQSQNTKNIKAWQNLQKLRYLLFLIAYQQDLERGFNVQKIVWYTKLSQFVGNVQPYQCGDYHQIKLSQHGSIQAIINHLIPRILMQKQQFIQEVQRAQQIILKDRNFCKNDSELSIYDGNKTQIIKFQQLIRDINLQSESASQKNESLYEEEISNQNQIGQKQLFVENIVVIQRDVSFRYSNSKEQEKKIEQIINIFKNYEPQVKNIDEFKKYCISVRIKESMKEKNQQIFKQNINQNKNLQFFFSDEEDQSNQQQSEEIERDQNNQKKNNQQYAMKCKKEISWKNNQTQKLITFLYIVKDKYEIKKQTLYKKCSQYLHSDKSPYDCKKQIMNMCKKYSGRFQDMLQKETTKLQILNQFIKKEREEYLMKEKNPLGCEIKIQFQPIKFIKQKSEPQTFELKVPTAVKLEFHPFKIQPQNQKSQKKNQNEEETVDKQRIKHLLHLKVSNQIFAIIKNSAKDKIEFKRQNNFIILIKKSKIKIEIELIKQKEEIFNDQKIQYNLLNNNQHMDYLPIIEKISDKSQQNSEKNIQQKLKLNIQQQNFCH